jgi:hypothetical protein
LDDIMRFLLQNVSANTPDPTPIPGDGSEKVLMIWLTAGVEGATYGGGTIAIQLSPDGGLTWISPTGVTSSWTTDTAVNINYIPQGSMVRATLIGATDPLGVNAGLF